MYPAEGEIYHYLSGYFTQSILDDFLSMKLTDVEKAAVRENVFSKEFTGSCRSWR